jgi:hypothetical protein
MHGESANDKIAIHGRGGDGVTVARDVDQFAADDEIGEERFQFLALTATERKLADELLVSGGALGLVFDVLEQIAFRDHFRWCDGIALAADVRIRIVILGWQFRSGEGAVHSSREKLGAIPMMAEVILPVQKLPGNWNIVHTGNEEHAFVIDHPTQKPLCRSELRIAQRMATQVQTCLMKGLTKNVEALNTVRQQ